MVIRKSKSCTICCKTKNLSEFYSDKRMKDGRRSSCKLCYSKSELIYRAANAERLNARSREYYRANTKEILSKQKIYRANKLMAEVTL